MRKVRLALAVLLALLPGGLRRVLATRVLGWDIHPTAHLGRSLIIADQVSLGPRASIGTGNLIKGLSELRLDEDAAIMALNWISGPALGADVYRASPRRHPALIMKAGAGLTSMHVVDCSDTVTLEEYAIVGGIRSTIFTHSVNLVRSEQRTARVTIGERAAVLSNSLILAGTAVAPRSVVSAGSVVNTVLTKEHVFYRGNPAVEVRDLPPELGLFQRTSPHIT